MQNTSGGRSGGQRRPRLTVLTSTFPNHEGDGTPPFVSELCSCLVEQFEVTVLAPDSPGAISGPMNGYQVVRFRYAPRSWQQLTQTGGIVASLQAAPWRLLLVPGFVLGQWLALWRLRHRTDLVHAHWLIPQGFVVATLGWLCRWRLPFAVTAHGADLYALRGQLLNGIKRFVVRRAAAVTVVSGAMREELVAIGASTHAVSVLSMGVNMSSFFTPGDATGRSAREILFVGRLVEKKGLQYLIRALPEIVRVWPDVRLTIAGSGPEQERLSAEVQALGLTSRVEFLGTVAKSALPALYRRAALFVAPFVQAESGDQEGLGLVVIEALACGCPVLVGEVPAVKEVFGADCSYWVVDPRNTAMLARRISERLADPERAASRALEFSVRLRARFDWPRVGEAYSQLLNRCLQDRWIRPRASDDDRPDRSDAS